MSLCSVWPSLVLSALRLSATGSSTALGYTSAQPGVVLHTQEEDENIIVILDAVVN